jgi:hypothetical protein
MLQQIQDPAVRAEFENLYAALQQQSTKVIDAANIPDLTVTPDRIRGGSVGSVLVGLSTGRFKSTLIDERYGAFIHALSGSLAIGAQSLITTTENDGIEALRSLVIPERFEVGAGTIFEVGAGAIFEVLGSYSRLSQTVIAPFSEFATGTTRIPIDDTPPLNNEGDEYMTASITPRDPLSLLLVTVHIVGASSAGATNNFALFRDSIVTCLAPGFFGTSNAASWLLEGNLQLGVISGSTAPTTFKVRAATNSGTLTFNGFAGARVYGPTPKSYIIIEEYLP